MNKITFATLAASALATLTIGLAGPAFAAPSGVSGNNETVTTVDSNAYPMSGQTPYGTYQNGHKNGSGMR